MTWYEIAASGSVIDYTEWNNMVDSIYTAKAGGISGNAIWKDGTRALTGDWDAGSYDIRAADLTADADLYISNKLYHLGDTNTYIDFSTADRMDFYAGGKRFLSTMESTGDYFWINPDNDNSVVFRVDGGTGHDNLLVATPVTDKVGIGAYPQQYKLEVVGTISGHAFSGTNIKSAGYISTQTGIYANFISANASNLSTGGSTTLAGDMVGNISGASYTYGFQDIDFISSQAISGGKIKVSGISVSNHITKFGDTNTYIDFTKLEEISIVAGDATFVTFDEGAPDVLHINPDNEAFSFRLDGSVTDYMMYMTPETNRIGIGTDSPNYLFDVDGSAGATTLFATGVSSQSISGQLLALHMARDITGWDANDFTNSGLLWNGSAWEAMPSGGAGGGGASDLSDLTIDVDKDWQTYSIYNMTSLSSQKISGGTIIGGLHYPADYIIYKEGTSYYAKNGITGKVEYSNAGLPESGAKGAIQYGLDNLSGGGKVYLTPAKYYLSSSVEISSYGTLEGSGPSSCLFLTSGALLKDYYGSSTKFGNPAITNKDWTNGNEYITIKNLRIDGNGDNQPQPQVDASYFGTKNVTTKQMIYLISSNYCNIDNCSIQYSKGGGIKTFAGSYLTISNTIVEHSGRNMVGATDSLPGGIWLNGMYYGIIDNCITNDCYACGITLEHVSENAPYSRDQPESRSKYCIVRGCSTSGTATGIIVEAANYSTVENNVVTYTNRTTGFAGGVQGGIYIHSVSSASIIGNIIEYSDASAIQVDEGTHKNYNLNIANNNIRKFVGQGVNLGGGDDTIVLGNIIYSGGGSGVYSAAGVDNAVISNNIIKMIGNYGIIVRDNYIVEGNKINTTAVEAGIVVYGDNSQIRNNHILHSGKDGIRLSATNNTIVDGNFISGSDDWGIYRDGSNYNLSINNNMILNSDYDGIKLQDCYSGSIIGNVLIDNDNAGIELQDAHSFSIVGNRAYQNNYGIELTGDSDWNLVSNNHLRGNNTGGFNEGTTGTNNKINNNISYVTENSGWDSASDAGTIAHGCASKPKVTLSPSGTTPIMFSFTVDSSDITVYHSSPDSETFAWSAIV